ncbi:ChaN family lipoprotein [Ramlibacter sp. PS3R-8]|uniref:ChaN family lipoprotein n=1 Tax=Ramlibacter sp. PS3R-8 TaxID=3133437 RepID=UPI003099FA5E
MRFLAAIAVPLLLAGCSGVPLAPETPEPAKATEVDVLLLGEQHDAQSHARTHERWVTTLAAQGRLEALALEMAEQGTSTGSLQPTASEQQVQLALRWNVVSWPWPRYAPAVMAAVRAGVPVVGANLPMDRQRQAMRDDLLDQRLTPAALAAQRQAVRDGHCDTVPAQQIPPMTRIQIARDVSMAQTVASLARPGKTVVLVAGSGHVRPDVGVPLHLPPTLTVRPVELPKEETGRDYCAELRKQMEPRK